MLLFAEQVDLFHVKKQNKDNYVNNDERICGHNWLNLLMDSK